MSKQFLLSATLISFSILSVNLSAFSSELKTTAKIVSFKNFVQLKYGKNLWRNASVNQLVKPGTLIRTGANSKAQIIYIDGTITNIGGRTYLSIVDNVKREIKINSGNLWYKVTKKSYGLKIFAPNAIASILGTEGGVKVETIKNTTKPESGKKPVKTQTSTNVTLVVAEGTVSVAMNNKNYKMNAGDRVSYSTSAPTVVDYKNLGVEKVKDLVESSK